MTRKKVLNLDFFKRPLTTELFGVKAKEVGLPPGSLIHVGEQKIEKPVIGLVDYDQEHFDTRTDISIEEATTFKETESVSWINLSGIHDISLIERFGEKFGIHNLALEDILNTQHRPKVEEMDGYSLIILKMLHYNEKSRTVDTEQVSLILGKGWLLSFQERPGDVWDGVRRRIETGAGYGVLFDGCRECRLEGVTLTGGRAQGLRQGILAGVVLTIILAGSVNIYRAVRLVDWQVGQAPDLIADGKRTAVADLGIGATGVAAAKGIGPASGSRTACTSAEGIGVAAASEGIVAGWRCQRRGCGCELSGSAASLRFPPPIPNPGDHWYG